MKTLTKEALDTIDAVQAVFSTLKTNNPGVPDQAVATLTQIVVEQTIAAGDDITENE